MHSFISFLHSFIHSVHSFIHKKKCFLARKNRVTLLSYHASCTVGSRQRETQQHKTYLQDQGYGETRAGCGRAGALIYFYFQNDTRRAVIELVKLVSLRNRMAHLSTPYIYIYFEVYIERKNTLQLWDGPKIILIETQLCVSTVPGISHHVRRESYACCCALPLLLAGLRKRPRTWHFLR